MDATLTRVLEATGYLVGGEPAAPSVAVAEPSIVEPGRHGWTRVPSFRPDAWWRSNPESGGVGGEVGLRAFFKYVDDPDVVPVADWQREVWNHGFAPLLWIVSPRRVQLYNGFGLPKSDAKADENVIETFSMVDEELARLDLLAGRLVMETGQVWERLPDVDRATSVDERLLLQIGALERRLVHGGLDRGPAQALIGRAIFAQYLVDGGLIERAELQEIAGCQDLCKVFEDREATASLFGWLRETFNGDMFGSARVPAESYLQEMGDFLSGMDPETRQTSLFPYRFDVIPVELISAIYEQFVHSQPRKSERKKKSRSARERGVFYTPLTAVSLVLDEVFEGLSGEERVLDLTCGSSVFLVEALRRLVLLKSDGKPTRRGIREVLYEQVYGVDISRDAIRIASFSLYLAALELDPTPRQKAGIKFEPLVGRTLLVGDAVDVELAGRSYDLIVGNPPWSFRGRKGTATRRARTSGSWPIQPRGESLDFVQRAMGLASDGTRLGMILSATSFFGRSSTGQEAAQAVVRSLDSVTLVNLSELSHWLFPKAKMPAMVLLGTWRRDRTAGAVDNQMVLVHARWSPSGQRSHLIELSPNDIAGLPVASWERNASLFKAAFLGFRHDLLLLDEMTERFGDLEDELSTLGTPLRTGLTFGDGSDDASFLRGLPLIRRGVRHFWIPEQLPTFNESRAQWPRHRDNFEGPVLLVGEYLQSRMPRVVTAVADSDVVYTDAYYGMSLKGYPQDIGYLLAGILSSSFASWYLLMSASAFGIWIRRVKKADLMTMPMPDLQEAVGTREGKRILALVQGFHRESPDAKGWSRLDDAVADLYRLDDVERTVVEDGLFRATWQWDAGRRDAVAHVREEELQEYAETFLSSMDSWLADSGQRSMRGEIYRLGSREPVRVIRFLLDGHAEDGPPVDIVTPSGRLHEVLGRIGGRAQVRVSNALVGLRDLRVHAGDEVCIIKPAARRYWLRINAIEDADAVIQDVFDGVPAE